MNKPIAFLAPVALLALGVALGAGAAASVRAAPLASSQPGAGMLGSAGPLGALLATLRRPLQPPLLRQVRIVQHFTIRITAGGPMLPPDALIALQQDGAPAHFKARRMGKCLPWTEIEAVQGGQGNKLLLFMRDQRIISADLDKSCDARDFYAGFLFARTADGNLCINRDMLQARSGANCHMRRLRELIQDGTRR